MSFGAATAYETDQFTNRSAPLADSTAVLDREVNKAIAEAIASRGAGRDEMTVVNGIYRKIGGRHWVDRIERWANQSDEVDKLDLPHMTKIIRGLFDVTKALVDREAPPVWNAAGEKVLERMTRRRR